MSVSCTWTFMYILAVRKVSPLYWRKKGCSKVVLVVQTYLFFAKNTIQEYYYSTFEVFKFFVKLFLLLYKILQASNIWSDFWSWSICLVHVNLFRYRWIINDFNYMTSGAVVWLTCTFLYFPTSGAWFELWTKQNSLKSSCITASVIKCRMWGCFVHVLCR